MVFLPLKASKKPPLAEIVVLAEDKSIDVISAEQLKIPVRRKSAELLQTLPETSKDVERRRHFSDSQKSSTSCTSSTQLVAPMACNDSFYYKSLDRIPLHRAEYDECGRSKASREEPPDKSWLAKIGVTKKMRQTFTEIIDFRLLADIFFLLFAVSNLLTAMAFVIPYVFLPNRGLSLGFDTDESSWLISAVGISNTFGRVAFGFIGDMKCVNRLVLCNTLRVICGIYTVISVFFRTFPLQICFAFTYGFLIGT